MTLKEAMLSSGSTCSAYRYHDGELITASIVFSHNAVRFGDARGYINGVAVYPSPDKYMNKEDWEPWPKLKALHTKISLDIK